MVSTVLDKQQIEQSSQSIEVNRDWDIVIQQNREKLNHPDTDIASQAACYAVMAKALVQKGEDEAAIAAYTESINRKPNQSENHYALGILYTRIDKPARAICHYQKALQLQPSWAQAIFRLGNLFHRLGSSLQAYEAYQRAIAVAPNHAEAHLAIGIIHEQRSEPRLAIKHYQKAAYLQPKQVQARRGVGRILTKLKAYDAAADVYKRTLAEIPRDAQTYADLAQVLLIQGEAQQAIAAYRQALDIDNTLVRAHLNLGRLWQFHQDLDGAIACYEQALRQIPDSLPILSEYANVLAAKGEWENLIESFRIAIKHQPNWITDYCSRTVHLSEQDLLFRMQRTCARFLIALQQAKSPETTIILKERLRQIHEYMGDLSVACDALKRAEQCYRTALSIMPDALDLYVKLGECLKLQGRSSSAIAIYQTGISQANLSPADLPAESLSHSTQPSTTKTSTAWRLKLEQRYQNLLTTASTHSISNQHPLSNDLTPGLIRRTVSTVKDWSENREEHTSQQTKTRSQTISPPEKKDVGEENRIEGKTHQAPTHPCGGVTCPVCMGQLIQKFSPVQVGKKAFRCSAATVDFPDQPTFTDTIPNGKAWVVPQKDAWNICNEVAVLTPDDELIENLSRSYPWYLPGCEQHMIESHTLLSSQQPLPEARYLSGNVAVLSSLSGHIYYHWMFDVLPRIAILQRSLAEQGKTLDDIDFFIVNNIEKNFQKETLTALGIPLNKVIASDRFPHIQAQHLVAPSFAGHLDWVPTQTLDFLRQSFLKKNATPQQNQPNDTAYANYSETPQKPRINSQRIYITRSGAKYRHIFNEKAVIEMLSQLGFVSVALETLSVAEQIALFADAEIIVAPHGSGLTNLAFCNAGTTVIECFSPNYVRTDYWMISEALSLHHYYLIGESFECQPLRQLMYPSGLTEDFSIDIGELRSLIRTTGITT